MKNKASASGTAAHAAQAIHDDGARRSSRQRIDLSRADEGIDRYELERALRASLEEEKRRERMQPNKKDKPKKSPVKEKKAVQQKRKREPSESESASEAEPEVKQEESPPPAKKKTPAKKSPLVKKETNVQNKKKETNNKPAAKGKPAVVPKKEVKEEAKEVKKEEVKEKKPPAKKAAKAAAPKAEKKTGGKKGGAKKNNSKELPRTNEFITLLACANKAMLRLFSASLGIALGLLVFQAGFLLRRQELQLKSKCADANLHHSACWMKQQYKRVILLLIDALRADFLAPNQYDKDSHFYSGQMKKAQKNLTIFALTTGNLPTFIDASDNFSPDAVVHEDSIIFQARSLGKNITLLGDDTWLSLYPSSFAFQHVLPSFDINDLTTNDDTIRPLLKEEMKRPQANSELLIAHFLGVDHCGHKFGPNHPKMSEMLQKIDSIIWETAEAMQKDELLVVIGDHGMTSTGDHGGDSEDETNAGIFVYSPERPLAFSSRSLQQIDLVPTLSLLLGLPIPFSNLGTVIESLFPNGLRNDAIALNYEQIKRFAETYASAYSFTELHSYLPFEAAGKEEQLRAMSRIQSALRSAWTRFDETFMRLGLLSLIEALLFLSTNFAVTFAACAFRSGIILLQLAVLFGGTENNLAVPMILMIATLSSCFSLLQLLPTVIRSSRTSPQQRLCSTANLALLFVFLHAVGLLSNSFIVYEGVVVRFALQSIFICMWAKERFSFSVSKDRKSGKEGTAQFFRVLLGVLSMLLMNWYIQKRVSIYGGQISGSLSVARALLYPIQLGILMHGLIKSIPIPPALEPKVAIVAIGVAQIIYALSIASFILAAFSRSNSPALRHFLAVISISQIALLLLGEGLLPAAVLFLLIALHFAHTCQDTELIIRTMSLLIPLGFYFTGHSPTLTAIPWTAAFVGLPGNFFLRIFPAFLILTHICISSLIVPLSLYQFSSIRAYHLLLFFSSISVLFSSIAALIHKRHLMVWKIFAPKFIFEGVSLLYLIIVINICAIVMKRVK
ncbi:hypothetical protein WR25_00145 [Diploscapter pachys]|uniref:Uncharacterized protein n=1 Tax=Diploscapter pachys TaxID=2018661 RepID=A0A2A2JLF9_9BILA|nr:hypothetical protein WR25_00145 [Diploscapter pachys]